MKPPAEMTDRETWAWVGWLSFVIALVITVAVAAAGGGAWGLFAFASPLAAAVRWRQS